MAKRKMNELEPMPAYEPEPNVSITLPRGQQNKILENLNLKDGVKVRLSGQVRNLSIDDTCCHLGLKLEDITVEAQESGKSLDDAIKGTEKRR